MIINSLEIMEELEKEIQKENQQEPEKSYILNKGLPRFVGDTEFKRLRAVIDEKNALIEKFKAYDEERKAYYKDIQNLVDKLTEEKKALQEVYVLSQGFLFHLQRHPRHLVDLEGKEGIL